MRLRSGLLRQGTQRAKGINDSPEIFMADTVRGGATNEKLAHTLVYESGAWLSCRARNDP